jgi:uncharacterized protein (DUF697 family)
MNESKNIDQSSDPIASGEAIVWRYTLIAAGIGLIPSPTVNSVGVAVLELAMIDELAKNYSFPFPTKLAAAKAFISLVGSLGPVYLALKSKSTLSSIPFVGHFVASSIYSITGALSVYVVGKLFKYHFETGGTFLSKDNSTLRKMFRTELENGKKELPIRIASSTTS